MQTNKWETYNLGRPTADMSRHYVFKGSSTFEMHAEELDRILISVYMISLVNLYHRNIV